MKLRAEVKRVTGATQHYHATLSDGQIVRGAQIGRPSWVQIEPAEGAFFLIRYDSSGNGMADTWHQTLQEAQAQARFEYAIEESDWTVMPGEPI